MNLTPDDRRNIAKLLAADLEQHTAEKYDDGFRKHLGASQIGDACSRKLWYGFNWVSKATYKSSDGLDHKGRMLRLFNRGHLEEIRFVEWLRGMGHTVVDTVDGKQIRISDIHGHFGGSCDGTIEFGGQYASLPKMLLEFKTSGDKAFVKLVADGVKRSKPLHYSQMSTYGKYLNLRYALYMCVNKNTDEIHIEIVELDWNLAEQLTAKAQQIISATEPPPRLNENSAYFECKYCEFAPVCHGQAAYEINCRSCRHSMPDGDKRWYCHQYKQQIPDEFIGQGCPAHEEKR